MTNNETVESSESDNEKDVNDDDMAQSLNKTVAKKFTKTNSILKRSEIFLKKVKRLGN